jgi:hypothetical protein
MLVGKTEGKRKFGRQDQRIIGTSYLKIAYNKEPSTQLL